MKMMPDCQLCQLGITSKVQLCPRPYPLVACCRPKRGPLIRF